MPTNGTHTNGNGHAGHPQQGFGARVDEINNDAQKLIGDARDAVNNLTASVDLTGRVERHPYGMIAAAVGVGYLLGGGLFTPLSGRIVRLGMRFAALPFVRQELVGMAEAALDGLTRAGAADSSVPPAPGAVTPQDT